MTDDQATTLLIGACAALSMVALFTSQACRNWLRFLLPVGAAAWVGLQVLG